MAASLPVAVVTRWVVPSHLTTLRIAGYLQGHPQSAGVNGDPQLALPQNADPSTTHTRVADEFASTFSASNGMPMENIQVGLPMVTQDPVSDFPGIRSDNLKVTPEWGSGAGGSGVVSILVQAL
jgi:hypothetical protein